MAVSVISTAPYDGYSVLFSSFPTNQIALVGGTNYGIAGSGGLIIYDHSLHSQSIREIKRYQWKDVLYDVTWSELQDTVCVVASGDGNVLIFDLKYHEPVAIMTGHTGEVCSVEWSISRKEQHIISSSWDKTIKLWDPNTGTNITTLNGHTGLVYTVKWSPHLPSTVASVSGDGTLKLWDLTSSSNTATVNEGERGGNEVLTCAWNKYNENILCTGGTEQSVKLWDIRQLSIPLLIMRGHDQTVREVKFDPHSPNIIGSASYDFTVRLWDTANHFNPLIQTLNHHTEFTYSMDFCLHQKGLVSDCSWDKTVKIYTPSCLSSSLHPSLPPTLS